MAVDHCADGGGAARGARREPGRDALYTARAELFVSARGTESLSDLVQGTTFTSRVMRSYVRLVQTPHVLQPVVDELGLDTTAAALAGQVRAENPLDTVLLGPVSEWSGDLRVWHAAVL